MSPVCTINSSLSEGKYRSLWAPSSFNNSSSSEHFLDSLDFEDNVDSAALTTMENSSSHRFQTANTFLWKVGAENGQGNYYDSINSEILSSLYQQNGGENMAEYDSLDKNVFFRSRTEN